MGLLHQGGVILSRDIDDMKLHIQKVQFVYRYEPEEEEKIHPVFGDLQVLTSQRQGRVRVMTVRGTREDVENVFSQTETVFHEILSPTLEEIFISETEVAGYDVKKFILS
jgi:ABC-2 type transport system ATP-binding protein